MQSFPQKSDNAIELARVKDNEQKDVLLDEKKNPELTDAQSYLQIFKIVDALSVLLAVQNYFPGFLATGAFFYGMVLFSGISLMNHFLYNHPVNELSRVGGSTLGGLATVLAKNWPTLAMGGVMAPTIIHDFTQEYSPFDVRHPLQFLIYFPLGFVAQDLTTRFFWGNNKPSRGNDGENPVQFLLQPAYQFVMSFCWVEALRNIFNLSVIAESGYLALLAFGLYLVRSVLEHSVHAADPFGKGLFYQSELNPRQEKHGNLYQLMHNDAPSCSEITSALCKNLAWGVQSGMFAFGFLNSGLYKIICEKFSISMPEKDEVGNAFLVKCAMTTAAAVSVHTLYNIGASIYGMFKPIVVEPTTPEFKALPAPVGRVLRNQ